MIDAALFSLESVEAFKSLGLCGHTKDYPVERMMRDAEVSKIWEGTNQIQRLLVAKHAFQD